MTQNLSKKCVKMDGIISNINAKVFYFCKIVWDGVENGKKQSGRWNNVDAIFLIFWTWGKKCGKIKQRVCFFHKRKFSVWVNNSVESLFIVLQFFFSSFWCFLRNVFAIFPQEKNIFHFFVSMQMVSVDLEGNFLTSSVRGRQNLKEVKRNY